MTTGCLAFQAAKEICEHKRCSVRDAILNISLFNLKLKRRGDSIAVWHSLPKVVVETLGN